jgi:cell division protein FtsA
LEHGSALVDEAMKGRTVNIVNELGLPLKTINVEHLQRIMSLRLEEIFQLVELDLAQVGLAEYLRAGVFLCGGGARVPQIAKLAEPILQMPVSLGQTNSVSGLKSALDQPEFVTAIGLARFGSFKNRKREGKTSLAQGIKSTLTSILRR